MPILSHPSKHGSVKADWGNISNNVVVDLPLDYIVPSAYGGQLSASLHIDQRVARDLILALRETIALKDAELAAASGDFEPCVEEPVGAEDDMVGVR